MRKFTVIARLVDGRCRAFHVEADSPVAAVAVTMCADADFDRALAVVNGWTALVWDCHADPHPQRPDIGI